MGQWLLLLVHFADSRVVGGYSRLSLKKAYLTYRDWKIVYIIIFTSETRKLSDLISNITVKEVHLAFHVIFICKSFENLVFASFLYCYIST